MKEEHENTNRLDGIKSQLYQIKMMLMVLIALCILGFYGISRAMWDPVAVTVTKVCEALLVIPILIAPAAIIVWLRALGSLSRTKPNTDKAPQNTLPPVDSRKD